MAGLTLQMRLASSHPMLYLTCHIRCECKTQCMQAGHMSYNKLDNQSVYMSVGACQHSSLLHYDHLVTRRLQQKTPIDIILFRIPWQFDSWAAGLDSILRRNSLSAACSVPKLLTSCCPLKCCRHLAPHFSTSSSCVVGCILHTLAVTTHLRVSFSWHLPSSCWSCSSYKSA